MGFRDHLCASSFSRSYNYFDFFISLDVVATSSSGCVRLLSGLMAAARDKLNWTLGDLSGHLGSHEIRRVRELCPELRDGIAVSCASVLGAAQLAAVTRYERALDELKVARVEQIQVTRTTDVTTRDCEELRHLLELDLFRHRGRGGAGS